jgi:hypothetical protein
LVKAAADSLSHRLADAVAEAVSGPWKLLSPERHHFFVVHCQPLWPKVATTSIRKYPELTLSVSYVGTDAVEVSRAHLTRLRWAWCHLLIGH